MIYNRQSSSYKVVGRMKQNEHQPKVNKKESTRMGRDQITALQDLKTKTPSKS